MGAKNSGLFKRTKQWTSISWQTLCPFYLCNPKHLTQYLPCLCVCVERRERFNVHKCNSYLQQVLLTELLLECLSMDLIKYLKLYLKYNKIQRQYKWELLIKKSMAHSILLEMPSLFLKTVTKTKYMWSVATHIHKMCNNNNNVTCFLFLNEE